jgi:Animal haem peroxidase
MLTDDQIEEIAFAMKLPLSDAPQFIDAGYTYFGQFIAHDIVPKTHPMPEDTRKVNPWLMLESVYGTADQTRSYLDSQGMFPIAPSVPGGPDDLPRTKGVAHIPDRRNDDNVIVSQFHLFWQRLHNFTIASGCAKTADDAQRLVILVYQLLVVEDYLRQIIAPSVFDSYFRSRKRWLGLDASAIPPQFALAAFRFGHSMVRRSYASIGNTPLEIHLRDLFRSNQNLQPDSVIDWSGFFGWPTRDSSTQNAMRIDPYIVTGMTRIPGGVPDVDIVMMNLSTANHAGVPAGRTYLNQVLHRANGPAIQAEFGLKPLPDMGMFGDQLTSGTIHIDNLPLWPYVLVEAVHASGGRHLGILGSLICAEVLANAIASAPVSIYRIGPTDVDAILNSLGPLGVLIQDVRRSVTPSPPIAGRTFCMRHIVKLVMNT